MTLATPTAPQTSAAGPLEDLVHCLEAEYSALLTEDYDSLEAILAQKELLLARLASLPAAAVGPAQGDRARAGAPWKQAFARIRDLNRRNALVLAPRAAGNRARLHFLQSALGRGALYAADGSVRPTHLATTNNRSA
jgi:flagellar biosynthesis/type III secretory pathway chaperone